MALNENVTVDFLKTESGDWNLDLLQSSFITEAVDMILSIPPSNPSFEDSLLWHFEKEGEYSVRSGYRVARDISSSKNICSSSLDGLFSWWCASHDRLHALVYLARRGVPTDCFCPRCHRFPESISHAFVWLLLWFCQNQLVQKLYVQDIGTVVSWVCDFLEEWKAAHCGVDSSSKESASDFCRWKPPEDGFFKINTDAATDYKNRLIGFGVIIRDRSSQVKIAAA
ncbi:hypothetical protein Dsin_008112 [Dipteronia sinensis]|uniref:Reverse transcriptase zinc-binding domain-containing protein n=1 Tax=Dipteronia sinensis TaxID=43782 RepID=A0AAE0EJ42_9ROSI|nr:hypothetical protein Dsin_008112 [Dipteronia sinensis]